MINESVTTFRVDAPSRLRSFIGMLQGFPRMLWDGTKLMLMFAGIVGLLFLWAYIKYVHIEESGHHELWLYEQICPDALYAASQPLPIDMGAVNVEPPRVINTERFFEACVKEAKH
jgi:hypothetical protein